MSRLLAVVVACGVTVSLAMATAGCRDSSPPAAAKGNKPAAAHVHADEHAEHEAARPGDLASGIVALKKDYQAIKDAFAKGDTEQAHEPLHDVGNVLEALPQLGKSAHVPAADSAKLSAAADKMFAAYGRIDGALHAGKPADYSAVAKELDEGMAAIETLQSPASPGERPLRLAFITCCKDAVFFEPVKKGMQDAAQKMGVECTWMGVEGVDMPAQAQLVTQAVNDKCDGIAVNLVDPEAFDKVVEDAIKQGVPVVGFNTDDHATPNARMSCVNQRLYEAGRALAEHVAADIPEGAHVLMTMHDQGVSSLQDRLRGMQDVLKSKNVTWTLCISGNDSAKGADVIEQELRKAPDIHVVLCTGQADTEAAGRAIEKAFAGQGFWAAGFDLSPTTLRLIKAGPIRCTVDQQPYIQGFYPVVQLTLYLRYGIVPASMDSGAAIITPESVDRALQLTEEKYR
jgi:simple sugar transport system substrate-binding protein